MFAHYGDLIWTSQWQLFFYFLNTKTKKNKKQKTKKNHQNNKKGTHLSKAIIINLPRMKKSNQNCG